MIFAGIVAGGKGTRMGGKTGDMPKQFFEIDGKPILVVTIEKFIECQKVDVVIVATNKEYLQETNDIIMRFFPTRDNIYIIAGGVTRNESLDNIVAEAVNQGAKGDDIVLTHDAVRPNVSQKIIKDNISCLSYFDACTTAIVSTDTVLIAENGIAKQVPSRENVFCVQTPQSFKVKAYNAMEEKFTAKQRLNATDISSLMCSADIKVGLIEGSRDNIKITTSQDLDLIKLLLK